MARHASEINVIRLTEPDLARQAQALLVVLGYRGHKKTPAVDETAGVEEVADSDQAQSTTPEEAEVPFG